MNDTNTHQPIPLSHRYKKGLMTQFPCARGRAVVCKNIGDYVQSVASAQFVDSIDCFIEQEEADIFQSDNGLPYRLIMNGWFQWRAENWPPSKDILPLLVSMHFSPLRQEQLLTPNGIKFLKENGPVGCRDKYTEQLLTSKNIPCYFSACVTLTLGKKYKVDDNVRHGVYIVDPYFEIPPLYEDVDGKAMLHVEQFNAFMSFYSQHSNAINTLAGRQFFKVYSPTGFLDRDESSYRSLYKAACFYKAYSKKFSDEILLNANYVTHWLDVDMAHQTTHDLFHIAEDLIKQYASAKLVITSRIHAGLPCLGMGTPVVFISNEEVTSMQGSYNTPGRLDGLVELFRVLQYHDGDFTTTDSEFAKIAVFTTQTSFENKTDWQPYAEKLTRQLTAFMSNDFVISELSKIRNMH